MWRYSCTTVLFLMLAMVPVGCQKEERLPKQYVMQMGHAPPTPSHTIIRDAALVITMDPTMGEGPLGVLEDADVLFEGDRIVAVGYDLDENSAMAHDDDDDDDVTLLDATGKIVMPGFVDVHNHLWQSVIRGCGADQDLLGWLLMCVFPVGDVGMSKDETYAAVRLSTYDVIDTGVTTVVDFSASFTRAFVRGNLRALDDSGLRYIYGYFGDASDFSHMRRVKAKLDRKPLAGFRVCSHPAASMFEALAEATQLAAELDVYLDVHLLENIQQREEQHMASLIDAGALDGKLQVDHAIHLNDEEIALLAENDVRVAHNPLSNMRLASGIIRMADLQDANLAIGLGLDGGTNDTSDMFANMRAAVGLQRAKLLDAAASPTVVEVLRMATLGGAEALDMEDTIGSLTPGKQADIIIIDPTHINFAPRWNLLNQLVFNGQPRNVEYVFVAGQVLKAEGEVLGEDRDEVLEAAERTAARLRSELGQAVDGQPN